MHDRLLVALASLWFCCTQLHNALYSSKKYVSTHVFSFTANTDLQLEAFIREVFVFEVVTIRLKTNPC